MNHRLHIVVGFCAMILARLFAPNVGRAFGAATLPIQPHSGATEVTTLAVASSIKPAETVGGLIESLILNRPDQNDEETKVVVFRPDGGPKTPVRALLFPAAAVTGTILSGESLEGTITRDDATKQTSAHSYVDEGGADAGLTAAIDAALAASKPKRSLSSLVNAIEDAISAMNDGAGPGAPMAYVVDRAGDGSVKIYAGAVAGTLTGKLADIDQTEAEEPTATSLW